MIIKTGQTVYELVRSFNPNTNNPIVPTTFMSKIYTNGVVNTGVTINVVLSDIDEGIYKSDSLFRLPNQLKMNIDNTEHKIVKGEMKDFITQYIENSKLKEFTETVEDIEIVKNESYESEDDSDEDEIEPVYRKKSIPLTVKRLVWNKYIGEEKGKAKCYCCRLTDITHMSFHCGHISAERHGGGIEIENLRPICQSCNSSMGTRNMYEFIETCGIHRFQ
jgi:hypothetical protein